MGLGDFHTLATKPAKGVVTWESEGTEGGRYHSRKLHVPSDSSGLTIGRGYDMAHRNPGQIAGDLMKAGVSKADADKIAKSAGKTGQSAKDFISQNKLGDLQISQASQLKLFQISYDNEAKEVRRISSKEDVVKKYGSVDWDGIDPHIKDIVIDLKFRGDYTGTSRQKIQKHIASNDLRSFAREICDKDNWPNVPKDRFERRKTMMEAAVSELEKREKAKQNGGAKPAGLPLHLGKTPLANKHKGMPA